MDFNESRINPLSILEEVSVLGSCFLSETWVYFLIAFVMRGQALHGGFSLILLF